MLNFALGFVCGISALGGILWIGIRSGHAGSPNDAVSFDEYMNDEARS